VVLFFRDNNDDIRYGLAGSTHRRRRVSSFSKRNAAASNSSAFRPTPFRGTFLIKELNQVLKYDGMGCKSLERTITLRSSKFLWRVTRRSRKRSSGALSLFSLLENSFLISLVSRPYANRLDVRPPRSARHPCRDALAGFCGLNALAGYVHLGWPYRCPRDQLKGESIPPLA
jgi:hypothetical protein